MIVAAVDPHSVAQPRPSNTRSRVALIVQQDEHFSGGRLHSEHETLIFASGRRSIRKADKQNAVSLGDASLRPRGVDIGI